MIKKIVLIMITISILQIKTYGYTIFDYKKDSFDDLIISNQNVKKEDLPEIVKLSTSSAVKTDTSLFLANIPVQGVVTSEYGYRLEGFHKGFDIAANAGDGIFACANGVVEYADALSTYGLMVKIDHGNGFETIYAHCSKILVKPGEYIHRGDKIAEVGNTGNSTGNHLHFEIIKNGERVNPKNFFIQSPDYSI